MKKLLLIGVSVIMAACTPPATHTADDDTVSLDNAIVISDARVRPPLPGKDIAAGYFDVKNHGNVADRLIAVVSPIADRVEIHTVEMTEGVMKMRRIEGIDLAPDESISFRPGGKHLMLFDVSIPDGQTDAALTLKFEQGPDLTVIAELTDDPIRMKNDHSNH